MTIAPLVLVGALVYKLIDWLKQIQNRNWNGVATQLIVWGAGVAVIWLVSASNFADSISLNSFTLQSLGWAGKVIVGLTASSLFSSFHDITQAIDNTQSNDSGALTSLPQAPAVDVVSANNANPGNVEPAGSAPPDLDEIAAQYLKG